MTTMPACPVCRTNRQVNQHGLEEFFCAGCRGLFDQDSSEGGDFSDRHPDARLIREENRREWRRQNQQRRRF